MLGLGRQGLSPWWLAGPGTAGGAVLGLGVRGCPGLACAMLQLTGRSNEVG